MMFRQNIKTPCPRHGLLAALVLCLPAPALAHETGPAFSLAEQMVLIWLACTAAFLLMSAKTGLDYLLAGVLFVLFLFCLAVPVILAVKEEIARRAVSDPPPVETAPGAAE